MENNKEKINEVATFLTNVSIAGLAKLISFINDEFAETYLISDIITSAIGRTIEENCGDDRFNTVLKSHIYDNLKYTNDPIYNTILIGFTLYNANEKLDKNYEK